MGNALVDRSLLHLREYVVKETLILHHRLRLQVHSLGMGSSSFFSSPLYTTNINFAPRPGCHTLRTSEVEVVARDDSNWRSDHDCRPTFNCQYRLLTSSKRDKYRLASCLYDGKSFKEGPVGLGASFLSGACSMIGTEGLEGCRDAYGIGVAGVRFDDGTIDAGFRGRMRPRGGLMSHGKKNKKA